MRSMRDSRSTGCGAGAAALSVHKAACSQAAALHGAVQGGVQVSGIVRCSGSYDHGKQACMSTYLFQFQACVHHCFDVHWVLSGPLHVYVVLCAHCVAVTRGTG